MNILVVSAHHDDLELGCGGAVAAWRGAGHRVVSLVMTHSAYVGADGRHRRDSKEALEEGRAAAQVLDYELIGLEGDTFDLQVCDAHAVRILEVLADYGIDTVLTHWHGDTHPPHRAVHDLVIHCSRRIPKVLGFAVNWYLGAQDFQPRCFVPIESGHGRLQREALACYRSEFERAGEVWLEHLEQQQRFFGRQAGVPRAEGFVPYKYLWEV